MRTCYFAAQVAGEHAPRREHGAESRHDHPLQIELTRNIGYVQSGGAAEGENGKAPGIDATAHRNQPNALRHMRVDDAVDPLSRAHAVDPQPVGDAIDGDLGGAAIKPRLAAEKVVGIKEAENETGVGDGRLAATGAVAGWARLRTRTLWPDMEDAAVVDARNRAAARANAGDIQALQGDALPGDAPVRADGGLAADHQGDIG